ncbi:hypothetical protein [Archangium lipolyticum]|uniref:hypothetical protein n=1 Tax=Archangium lipolyticum TaxID=2970465 RepID=UPI00214A04F2|nr:hypothetical protein [Archangium lipolyticum]
MQLRKMSLMLTVLGAVGMMLTGCGGGEETLTCTADTDCLESEICHPNARVCVQTCTAGADCPDTAKTCEALDTSSASSPKICKCSTDALCNTGRETADLECSDAYKVCVPTGTASGCTTNADCSSGQVCESGVCKTPTTGSSCQGEAQSSCTYGQYCASSTCTAVPAPTCPNFANNTAVKNFSPATGTGNIIYNVQKLIFGTQCGSDTTAQIVKARVSFYTKTGTLPTSKEGLNGFFYVKTDGGELPGVPLSNEYQRSADGKSASLSVNLCTDKNFDQIVLGFYFTGGNGYCATFTK